MMDIELLRKCAKCVYLATEKEVADDIAGYLNSAADEIISLRQQLTKPAPEAQILIDALRLVKVTVIANGWDIRNVMEKVDEALATYDTKATPDNGVEK
jgi:hypothetical protein